MSSKKHYVYRVTFETPINGKKYYIGKRSGELNDLYTGRYKTSSKDKDLIENWDKPKRIKILKQFNTAQEALSYESFLHKKFECALNPLFFNQSNQTDTSFDRTGLVTVFHKEYKENMTIPVRDFNPELHETLGKDMVACVNIETGEKIRVPKDEFESNPNLVGVRKGMTNVIDIRNNTSKYITQAEYEANRDIYRHASAGRACVIDARDGVRKAVSLEEFYENREFYKGVQSIKGHTHLNCEICGIKVQHANYNNHFKTHKNIVIMSDKYFSFLVVSEDYYKKYKQYGFFLVSENDWKGYWEGRLYTTKYLGKAAKHSKIDLIQYIKENYDEEFEG